jgi:hypothetical protein
MLKRWIPWKYLIQRAARSYNIIDPLTFLARIRQFSQPSEVQEPIELVRAGIAFHSRGLINTKAIQHNLDWIWPYWVEKQFDPSSSSFIPRAFSFSHVNLTHRNWTAVGRPDIPLYPIVDPRGLITPLYDGWSIDFWIIDQDGSPLLPSRLADAKQSYLFDPNLAVETLCAGDHKELTTTTQLDLIEQQPTLIVRATATSQTGGHLVVALRPYNPEGVQFIEKIRALPALPGLQVNDSTDIRFNKQPQRYCFANYHQGDVVQLLASEETVQEIECPVGMATAAALFPLSPREPTEIELTVGLQEDLSLEHLPASSRKRFKRDKSSVAWQQTLGDVPALLIPDKKLIFLFSAAVRTLLLLSSREIVPGPYTYKRFWFRDACIMLQALLVCGFSERVGAIIDTFGSRQNSAGYFKSQEGEWDSNGQVLWIMNMFQQMTGHEFSADWSEAVVRAAEWIIGKRSCISPKTPHAGLLPAGFSAEHLGPNDYYYWDDFWSVAGLYGASRLAGLFRSDRLRDRFHRAATQLAGDIDASIASIPEQRTRGGIPASPYRRMDAGAIGSMVADYPLQLTPPGDRRIGKTLAYIFAHCFYEGAFFQDMIHSGINIYLTLDVAQSFLRNGDHRYRPLIKRVAELASPTGQWPEAIHPLTLGGCMGDGQHGWAAAEWIMLIRNLFVREEGRKLIIGSGILPEWLADGEPIGFGPTLTSFGFVTVAFDPRSKLLTVKRSLVTGDAAPEAMRISLPGYHPICGTGDLSETFILEEVSS